MRVKAWHVLLLIAAVIVSLMLANWQWSRYTSGTGSLQNLGYALQWPMFGLFLIFIYRAGMRMENEKIDAENSGDRMQALYDADTATFGASSPTPTAADGASESHGTTTVKSDEELLEDFLPERPELDIDEFNALNTPRRRQHDQ
nr:Glucitol operon activator [Streptococcus thermophilus]